MQTKAKQISWQFMQKDYTGAVTASEGQPATYRVVYEKSTPLDREKDILIFRHAGATGFTWEQKLEGVHDEAENVRFVQALGAALEAAGLHN